MGDLEDQNKSVAQRFSEAVNSRRLDLLDDLVAPDFVRHCQATPSVRVRSLEDFKRFLEEDWAGAPDGQFTARFMVAEGNLVALYCTYAGTQTGPWGPIPPSGKRFELDFSGVFRMAGGKIAELWITWDNLALLTQLGHWPPK
jgi:steroid delta-isomerase-like uncharacterized protein